MSATSSKRLAAGLSAVGKSHTPADAADTPAAWSAWLLPAFALACWALAIRHLAPEWTLNEQYHFGWLVPLLAAYLVKVRFEHCPTPERAPSRILSTSLLGLLALAAALILPVREANLDWRLVEWSLVALAIAASLLCCWQMGGPPWVRHFAFPLFFFLIAVPVPRNLEETWMAQLMQMNASLSVETLHWLGVNAHSRGNLIQLPNCTLGVEEACSGIRSLQSTLMLSLFLGEILSFGWLRRLALLAAGVVWASLTNVVRTASLGWVAARDGLPAVDKWHNTAGFSVLAICSALVILTAWLLHRLRREHPAFSPTTTIDWRALGTRLRPCATAAAVGLAVLPATLGLTKFWFARQSRNLTAVTPWTFQLPSGQPHFEEVPISARVLQTLRFDDGYTGKWRETAGARWQAFYFRWEPGRGATQAAKVHDPRICLERAGMELVSELPRVDFERAGVALHFDAFHFLDGAEDLYVFNCLAEDVRTTDGSRRTIELASPSERIAAAIAGRRQEGQRRLQVAVWGAPDATTAARQFSALLDQQIHLGDEPLAP